MIKKSLITIIILAVVVASAAAAFQLAKRQNGEDGGSISVTATFYPLYEFASHVGGDAVSVVSLTPPGVEPHDFELSPRALIEAQESDMFIYNGGSLEPWVDGFLEDYSHKAVRASQGISLLEANHSHSHDHEHDEEHHHDEGKLVDPHFWLDPVAARQIVDTIRDGLIEIDPTNRQYYTDNAEQYNKKLAKLDQDFTDRLATCKLDTVISSHAAFSYLASRYDFHVESIAGIEPSDEPTPAKMAAITNIVREKGIKYVFFESLVSPRLSETIAREAGVGTLVFDPIEGLSREDQNKGRDYISVQYDNLENLATALECS